MARCSALVEADKYLQPKRGHIVIFPFYMWHGTVAIAGETDRLTVAADFLPVQSPNGYTCDLFFSGKKT